MVPDTHRLLLAEIFPLYRHQYYEYLFGQIWNTSLPIRIELDVKARHANVNLQDLE
jgi:hypothetical protein